jgi:Pin2-interacting protein X1
MLASQGWQPGDSLGASNAAHAAHYTSASSSHIRVLLKDDNLGLGAKRGSERAENFGLAGLESILGRLNGKEEEVKKEEERRDEIEKRAFVYRKYGLMNFVSGGFLVGDKIKSRDEIKKEPEIKVEVKSEPETDSAKEDSKSKKRKRRDREEPGAIQEGAEEQPSLKRKKKSMDLRDQAKKDIMEELSQAKKDKKSRKEKDEKKSKKEKKASTSDPETMSSDVPSPASDPEPLTDKAKRKAEKRVRKEEKKLKKALKRAAKEAAKSTADANDSTSESEDESAPGTSTLVSVPASGASTPVVTTAGLIFKPRGMHAVRQKNIALKKAASMNAQALREIFMIKTPS